MIPRQVKNPNGEPCNHRQGDRSDNEGIACLTRRGPWTVVVQQRAAVVSNPDSCRDTWTQREVCIDDEQRLRRRKREKVAGKELEKQQKEAP